MRKVFENTVSVLLTIGVLAIAAALVRREFVRSDSHPSREELAYIDGWERILPNATVIGEADAPIKLIEFSDLECPYCREFHDVVRTVRSEFGEQLAHVFVHYPIPQHRFALPAAEAADCAAKQSKFEDFVDAVYRHQDSLGIRTWLAYAKDAQISDTLAFDRCMADTTVSPRVLQGRGIGAELRITATPTVIINGWRFTMTPNAAESRSVIKDIIEGRKPHQRVQRTNEGN